MNEQETNTMRDFMSSSYGDEKLSKEMELNESMSITASAPDEYENETLKGGK